ncbi:histidine kinase [Actinocrispum sp. NPDC049592]|uniref:sensor histidine kinase n=1 Tax=Actinocrispum sp. NPDC049592 TaxID=3154835 RepID=UPI0034402EF1
MTRRDTKFDALAMVVAVALIVVSVLGPPKNAAYSAAGIAVECATLALLPFRRRVPLLVGWLVAVTAVAMTVAELVAPGTLVRTDLTPWVPLATTPLAAYSAFAFGTQRSAWVPVALLAILAGRPWEPSGAAITQALLLTVVPALVALYVSARRRLVAQALADQRALLAADLHDTITHRITVIILRAGVLHMSASDQATRAAAEELRVTGCQALEELRELLYVLPGGGTPAREWAPAPGLAPLVAESTAAGISTELVEQGDPEAISPVIRRTAHRIVQEALTNIRKHAPGASAHVQVRYGDDGVHLTVDNTRPGRAADPALVATGSGVGLHNLRLRVEMLGGTLRAGPADSGFRVAATLPVS